MKKATAFFTLLLSIAAAAGVYLIYREDIPPTLTDIEPAITLFKGLVAEQWHTPIVAALSAFWLLTLLLSLAVLFERNKVAISGPEKTNENQNELQQLREQLAQATTIATEASDKANQLLTQNENLNAQIEKFAVSSSEKNELVELKNKIDELQTSMKTRSETADKAEVELKNLQSEQKKISEEFAAARNKLEKTENDSKMAKREAEKTASQLKNIQSELGSKSEEVVSLRQQLEEMTHELEAAKANARGGTNAIPPAAYQILYLFQKEGRLIDLLNEDISSYDDETLGGAIRPIHEGCRKLLEDRLILEPVLNEEEGSEITLDEIDPETVKLSGNVPATGPYTGELIHRGWRLKECNLPELVGGWKGNVIAPAEIEIS
ncbi:MAG: DUF2760 domain-containing protein [Candidatus Riflebacteria bacterium]|nr:DUF2760 domain-containing protein [Candidatus Riflebacteria bacterium]